MNDPVEIVDYDPQWPRVFAMLRDDITAALDGLAQRIEHVGSTAVPGLDAKPIIDMTVVVDTRDDLPTVIDRLQAIGYRYEGDLGIPGREAFARPPTTPPHHLYVCAADNENLARVLAFRDFLRTHPDTVRAYATLKRPPPRHRMKGIRAVPISDVARWSTKDSRAIQKVPVRSQCPVATRGARSAGRARPRGSGLWPRSGPCPT